MFRLWGKIWKDNHLLQDMVFEDDSNDTRTHKVFRGLEKICYDFDLSQPIWRIKQSMNLNSMTRPVFIRIIL